MNDQTDSQLLRAYSENRSEAAFTELVRRHVDFVYSAARRMVCDPHLAEDVTQSVFVAFAKNARQLTDRSVLSGWLHRTAQNIAAQTVRTIERRRAREQEAVAMNELLAHESDAVWEHIAPHLDAALGELSNADRDALLLRYFERKSAREMALTFGISDDAAQKRVNRAVERLREFFSKRKVTIGASGLVVLISTNAVQAAPIGLIAIISSAASLAGTAVQTSTAIAATKTIVMTTLQKTLITATIAVAVGTGIYEARRASNLQKQIQILRQEQVPLAEQKMQREREDSAQQLAALREENERLNRNSSELLKLRDKVSRLQSEAEAAAVADENYEAEVQRALQSIPPVKTLVAVTEATVSWDEAIVTGGWKTPAGKRAIVLMTLERGDTADQLTIRSKILEFSEEAGEKLGLAQFNLDDQKRAKAHKLNAEQSQAILKATEGSLDVEVISSPTISTSSGRQAQIAVIDLHSTSAGEPFSTGPIIDFVPTISPNGQSVQMVTTAQLNYLVPKPRIERR